MKTETGYEIPIYTAKKALSMGGWVYNMNLITFHLEIFDVAMLRSVYLQTS